MWLSFQTNDNYFDLVIFDSRDPKFKLHVIVNYFICTDEEIST